MEELPVCWEITRYHSTSTNIICQSTYFAPQISVLHVMKAAENGMDELQLCQITPVFAVLRCPGNKSCFNLCTRTVYRMAKKNSVTVCLLPLLSSVAKLEVNCSQSHVKLGANSTSFALLLHLIATFTRGVLIMAAARKLLSLSHLAWFSWWGKHDWRKLVVECVRERHAGLAGGSVHHWREELGRVVDCELCFPSNSMWLAYLLQKLLQNHSKQSPNDERLDYQWLVIIYII